MKHRINIGDNLPVKQRKYRVSPAERRIIHDGVGKMLDRGIIQPSERPCRQIKILGHLVSEEGIMPDPGKTEYFAKKLRSKWKKMAADNPKASPT
ncbi:hypothetical protein TNCV_1459151 [Trichonephila clavipes]|nr:hypothetical protein TNCV_1459151 [Trichonephila clavipes]